MKSYVFAFAITEGLIDGYWTPLEPIESWELLLFTLSEGLNQTVVLAAACWTRHIIQTCNR